MFAAAKPRPIPSILGTVFGGLWALIAAMASPPDWREPIGVFAALMTLILVWRLCRLPALSPAETDRLFVKKWYLIAVIGEIVAIYAVSASLPHLGWQAYLLQAVGIIVGLHFIGLWRATRSRRFLAISAAMCVVSAASIPFPSMFHLFDIRDLLTGAGNALVLWIGAGQAIRRGD